MTTSHCTLLARGKIASVGRQIGIGKEADIYLACDEDGNQLCLKFHRLGRISFRKVREKRDYMKGRKGGSWLYLSRLAALKEYAFMVALHREDFPVPTPHDHNRHCVLMSLVNGRPMQHIHTLRDPASVYRQLIEVLMRISVLSGF